jgi:hypothetical protein
VSARYEYRYVLANDCLLACYVELYIEEAVSAGVKAFSVQSRVIRVKANQFYECPWNNDNTQCCYSSNEPVPKTAGPRGRVYHRIGATLHYGRVISDRMCTTECLWVGEDCVKASEQKKGGYMEGTLEKRRIVQDIAIQRQVNDSSVNTASMLMNSVEGLAFLSAELIAEGYNATINDKLLYIDIHLWDGSSGSGGSLFLVPDSSKDWTKPTTAAYLDYVTRYVPCKLN